MREARRPDGISPCRPAGGGDGAAGAVAAVTAAWESCGVGDCVVVGGDECLGDDGDR